MLRWFGISLWDQPVLQNRRGKKLCVPWSLLWDGSAEGCAEVTPGAALSRAQCWLLSSPVPSQPHQMFVPWEKIFLEGWGKRSWRVGAGQQEEMELPCSSATFPRTCRRCCLSQVPQWGAWGEISQPEKPSEPPGLWGNRIPLPYLLMEGRGERGRLLDLKINQMALSV